MFHRGKTYCLLFLIALLPFVTSGAIGQTLLGKVTRVVDGDTVAFELYASSKKACTWSNKAALWGVQTA